jgi:hypothetical protein
LGARWRVHDGQRRPGCFAVGAPRPPRPRGRLLDGRNRRHQRSVPPVCRRHRLRYDQQPYTYDYGSDVVYQDNTVYVGGKDAGTAEQYAQQATTIAVQGQTVEVPPTADWNPLGVFALVPGEQKTSNNLFQLAVDRQGVIRGNYYDGVMDTTTPVYGSVDKKNQRAAWTIGKTKDRVFEAGLYNLTQPDAPVLVHIGTEKTQQWLLVRVEQPAGGK